MSLLIGLAHSLKNLIGEGTYQRFRRTPLGKKIVNTTRGLHQFGVRTLSSTEIAQLHSAEVQTALTLGVLYAYNSFIEGDIVEFGTMSGATATALARAMVVAERARPVKSLHLFDSFVGLPEATSAVDKNSFEIRAGIWLPGTCRVLTKDELFQSCAGIVAPGRVVIHEGWFADTVPLISRDQKFSFIHFDGDMYQSTIDAIGSLLELGAISNGAVICFDDWNCGQADPNSGERTAWRDLTEKYAIVYSDWRAYSTMGRSFFIHDYRRNEPANSAPSQ
ncbi:MAG TPA: TylF/MycF/NovP-related O-methyltransferase [Beijerinckiaceae bacterium]|nr:TylF/MycF/NovP-related O-methyltransferase [Beijerinckiaceae bacterium]